jgi:hypothetical protein
MAAESKSNRKSDRYPLMAPEWLIVQRQHRLEKRVNNSPAAPPKTSPTTPLQIGDGARQACAHKRLFRRIRIGTHQL